MSNTKNKYPKAYYEARPKALERAGNKCERCGAENHKPHPVSRKMVRLQVHHKDKNPNNNTLENLRALCAICHGTENPPENRAKDGTFKKSKKTSVCPIRAKVPGVEKNSKKNSKKSRKIRHRQLDQLEGEDDLSKNVSSRVFIPKKINKKNNKKQKIRHRQLAPVEPKFPVSKNTKSAQKAKNTENEQGDLATKLSMAAVLKKIATLESDLNKERKCRSREREKYQKKEAQYDAERRKQEQNQAGELPYYKPFGRPVIRYSTDGKVYNPQTGKELTREEENAIWREIDER